MKRIVAVLVLASVILLAGCTSQPQPEASPEDASGEPDQQVSCSEVEGETHTVTYSSSGFSPQQVTVQRCDTVTWESQGASMWVASDVHPSHTEYDGSGLNQHCPNDGNAFDQCESGSSYSFTFEKTGEWGYHNHQLSGHGGTVVVQER